MLDRNGAYTPDCCPTGSGTAAHPTALGRVTNGAGPGKGVGGAEAGGGARDGTGGLPSYSAIREGQLTYEADAGPGRRAAVSA